MSIISANSNLPANLEDLKQFVLINREKLNAYRALLRTSDKLEDIQSVHEQRLKEAQDLAEAVLDEMTIWIFA